MRDRMISASGEGRELLSLLRDSLSVEIPEESPIDDGGQVFKSRNNFHFLFVDDTYGIRGEFRRKSKTISSILLPLSSKKLS